MKAEVSELVFCKNKYKTEKEFWNAIGDAVRLLLDAEYTMIVRYDEKGLGIVVIEYEAADRSLGGAYPVWTQED